MSLARFFLIALLGTAAFRPELNIGHLLDQLAPKAVEMGGTMIERSGCLFEEQEP